MQISTWVSSQKLRLISAAVRVNVQFLCCWRLRNQRQLDAVIEELSAEQATREPYSFLFVYYLKPKNEMFYKRFEERFALVDGRYLYYWVDAALGTLNWALLLEGLSVACDSNRILNDLELRQQFPDAVDYPAAPAASPTKPFSVDHMLAPSFVSGGQ